MIPSTLEDILAMAERFDRSELPIWNRGTEAHGDVQSLIQRCQIHVEAIALAALDVHDPRVAMRLLQLLGFAVTSVERHLQAAGAAPGGGVRVLRAASTLVRLGEAAGHLPRDSQYTYWLQSPVMPPITFTGAAQESKLIRTLSEMRHQQSLALAAIRPLCAGDTVSSGTGVEAMEFAASSYDQATMRLHAFLAPSVDPNMAAQFDVVARTMAMYLCEYPVGMTMYAAPDPMHIPDGMEMDLRVDRHESSAEMLRERMPWLMAKDRARIEAALQQPSLTMRIAETLGMTMRDLEEIPERCIAIRMSSRPGLQRMFAAFAHLTNAVETTTSYFAAICKTVKPAPVEAEITVSNIRTLAQRVDLYKTIPQAVEIRPHYPMAVRLLAAASS